MKEAGFKEALRRQRFPVVAALWSYIAESLEWRLILVTPTVEHRGPMAAYTRVQRILATISPSRLTLTDISWSVLLARTIKMFFAAISIPSQFGAATGRGHSNVIVEDAYVYGV